MKDLSKLGIDENFNLIKIINKIPASRIVLDGERLNVFSLKFRTK
jgi:hypothetical protein